ncbi:MAG: hypothetical protein IPM25_05680 [Chloracidobacterium sp.]|nr:hypothetical protein [Chloracidobacterium sp.]
MRTIFITLVIALVASATLVSAQQEQLSEHDYSAALAKALDAASSRSRRVLTHEKFYNGTEVYGTREVISDFAGNDAKKMEVVEEFNGKKQRSNYVTLNGQYFCKEGEKAWKRADKECAKAGKMMAIPDGDYEYFVEPDANNYGRKVYTRRASFTDSGVPERDAARLKSIEIKFMIDETGAIVEYTETRRGGIEPDGWSSTQVTKYIYEPADLRIADPTRGFE